MKKLIYLLAILFSVVLLIYFYLFNFDNMSETELLESVLYWYIPLVMGLYGITALRIQKTYTDTSKSALAHAFSGKDSALLGLVITIFVLGGGIGILLFILPLLLFKPKKNGYDISVSISGAVIWLIMLFLFFEIIWPSL